MAHHLEVSVRVRLSVLSIALVMSTVAYAGGWDW